VFIRAIGGQTQRLRVSAVYFTCTRRFCDCLNLRALYDLPHDTQN